ncbi:MAG: hypothetical protein K2X47_04430, partial [Bdellovibrionales bacterium]|nr:hypothetical protein [Bdellovibrionales bacterium]
DSVVPGDFMVTGVTAPPVDTRVDNWIGGRTPTVHWTASTHAIQYRVLILNQTGTITLCGPALTNSLTYAFPGSCLLAPGATNIARVEALTRSGAVLRRDLQFRVDSSAPIITLVGPKKIDPAVKAEFDLSVVDDGDLETVTCTHHHGATSTTVSCMNQPIVKFDQPIGTNRLVVVATDQAGNRAEKELIWVVKSCSCNPFDPPGTDNCSDDGLHGEIYYLTGSQINDFNAIPAWADRSVYYIITNGVRAPVDLRLPDINVPTRLFDTGFPIGDGNILKNERGENLIEYFAFRLNGYLKLGLPSVEFPAPADPVGHYQLALLSDDGAVMRIRTTPTGTPEVILNNDGFHPTKLKCASKTIELKADSKMQIMLDYFQGPRTHISLMLLWRKVDPTVPGALNDPLCNVEGNELYFGDNFNDFTAAKGYGQLLSRGWKVPTGRNFRRLTNLP